MSDRRFRLLLWIPFVVLTLLFIGWQQGILGNSCAVCGGDGKVPAPHIPEDPQVTWEDCVYCGTSAARFRHLARELDRMLPDGPIGPMISLSCMIVGVLIWGLRTVRCIRCDGKNQPCGLCGGRGWIPRLDLWVGGYPLD